MRLAICSDIHDNIWKLEKALQTLTEADLLLFCGDFCAPFTLAQLAEGFDGPIHAVFGNNDGDQRLLLDVAQKAGNVTLYGQFAELNLDGFTVGINHYPEIARRIAGSGYYRLVCYGHDHRAYQKRIDGTWLVNPGELMGRFGRSTYCVFDTTSEKLQFIEV